MQFATGLLFILTGIALAIMFRTFVVAPAATPSSGGEFGEVYGPIVALQWGVYLLCLLQGLVGLITVLIYRG